MKSGQKFTTGIFCVSMLGMGLLTACGSSSSEKPKSSSTSSTIAKSTTTMMSTTTTQVTTTTTAPPVTAPPAKSAPATSPPATAAPQQQPSVSYANCAAVKAAGAAPLYRGQPGYSSSLDRDGDGVACEK